LTQTGFNSTPLLFDQFQCKAGGIKYLSRVVMFRHEQGGFNTTSPIFDVNGVVLIPLHSFSTGFEVNRVGSPPLLDFSMGFDMNGVVSTPRHSFSWQGYFTLVILLLFYFDGFPSVISI
jgi:hypothetical protein